MKNTLTVLVFLISLIFGQFALSQINLEQAKKIAAKASVCGKDNKWKFSIAIVNSEGNLVYFERADDSYVGSIEAALDKAKSANAFQRPTKAFAEGLKDGRYGLLSVKNIIGIEGGHPINLNGKHSGAIGISGARASEDDTCATKALN